MAVIKKKIWPEYFEAVASGKKRYELRLNDFEINGGDIFILEEWNPKTKLYTGRKIEKKAKPNPFIWLKNFTVPFMFNPHI